MKKWWLGSSDGKNYVISQDKGDLPNECTPAPLHQEPTPKQITALQKGGAETVVVWKGGQNDS